MKKCHVCFYECSDSDELCPVCGADLNNSLDSLDDLEELKDANINNPVLLAKFEDLVTAEIFEDILKDNSIPFVLAENETGSMRVVFGGALICEEIYVDERDYVKAEELYTQFMESDENFGEILFEEDGEIE